MKGRARLNHTDKAIGFNTVGNAFECGVNLGVTQSFDRYLQINLISSLYFSVEFVQVVFKVLQISCSGNHLLIFLGLL